MNFINIKESLSNGKIEEVIEQLLQLPLKKWLATNEQYSLSNVQKNALHLTSMRLKRIKQNYHIGILKIEDYNLEIQRIANSILFLIDEIDLNSNVSKNCNSILKNKSEKNHIKCSLIGSAGSGKTIYLTMLFDYLFYNEIKGFSIEPADVATIEMVLRDKQVLENGKTVSRTEVGSCIRYSAQLSKPFFFRRKNFKLDFIDFSGEECGKLQKNDSWLHRAESFLHVIDSNIIYIILNPDHLSDEVAYLERIIDNYIAAIQNIRNNKRTVEEKNFPIGIMILKSDLFSEKNILLTKITTNIERLIKYCESKSHNTRCFLVSSFGDDYIHENWDNINNIVSTANQKLKPYGLIDPILWGLKALNI